MENHIKKTVQHYGTRCNAWDVVNEALNDNGTYRVDNFYSVIGEDYIPLAFQFANKYAPRSTKLYYNDYNIETAGAKATLAQQVVEKVKRFPGARIDGVGFQSHFTVGKTPTSGGDTPTYEELSSNINAFGKLGVEVALTELDIRMVLPATPELLQGQSDRYHNTTKACLDTQACIGITVWDFDDKVSHLSRNDTKGQRANVYLSTHGSHLPSLVRARPAHGTRTSNASLPITVSNLRLPLRGRIYVLRVQNVEAGWKPTRRMVLIEDISCYLKRYINKQISHRDSHIIDVPNLIIAPCALVALGRYFPRSPIISCAIAIVEPASDTQNVAHSLSACIAPGGLLSGKTQFLSHPIDFSVGS